MTDLQDKAISIKGKYYILVKDRIAAFNADYPEGQITTELVKHEGDLWVVKATVWPKWTEERTFTAYSQARESQSMVNKMAALENAESSAVGRALAMMGIGIIESIASADEMAKAGVGEVNIGKAAATKRAIGDDPLIKVRLPGESAPVASPETPEDAEMRQAVDESLGDEEHTCSLHNVAMKQRFARNGSGQWWDHRKQEGEIWMTCNGVDGFKAQKQYN